MHWYACIIILIPGDRLSKINPDAAAISIGLRSKIETVPVNCSELRSIVSGFLVKNSGITNAVNMLIPNTVMFLKENGNGRCNDTLVLFNLIENHHPHFLLHKYHPHKPAENYRTKIQ